jgi:hypothetical protein
MISFPLHYFNLDLILLFLSNKFYVVHMMLSQMSCLQCVVVVLD